MASGQLMIQAILQGRSHPDRTADHLGSKPRDTFVDTVNDTRAELDEPGVMERTLTTPFGERPGAMLTLMMATELVVHSWDLAKATGQSTDIDPELTQDMLDRSRTQVGEGRRGPTFFGEPQAVPDDASVADRLAAYLGRSVVVP